MCYAEKLPDGSYLTKIYPSTKDRRHDTNGIIVRAIDYRLKGVPDSEPVYRLLTTILDPELAPVADGENRVAPESGSQRPLEFSAPKSSP